MEYYYQIKNLPSTALFRLAGRLLLIASWVQDVPVQDYCCNGFGKFTNISPFYQELHNWPTLAQTIYPYEKFHVITCCRGENKIAKYVNTRSDEKTYKTLLLILTANETWRAITIFFAFVANVPRASRMASEMPMVNRRSKRSLLMFNVDHCCLECRGQRVVCW